MSFHPRRTLKDPNLNIPSIPLISFLKHNQNPSLLLPLPHPTQQTPFELECLWSNPAATVGTTPLISCIDNNSNLVLQLLVCRLAKQLAFQDAIEFPLADASCSADPPFLADSMCASGVKRKRMDSFMETDEFDPNAISPSDLVYVRRTPDSPERAYYPILTPLDDPSAFTGGYHIAVLQLCPIQGASVLDFATPVSASSLNAAIPSAPSAGAPSSLGSVLLDVDVSVPLFLDDKTMGSSLAPIKMETESMEDVKEPSVSHPMGEALKPDEERVMQAAKVRRSKFKVEELIDSFAWENTALGPKSQWPQSLKTAISVVMNTDHESALWWGKDLTLIYNDAYAEMLLRKHPFMFGKVASVAWSEIWSGLKDHAAELMSGGRAVHKTNDLLFFQREVTKAAEETYTTWSWIPVTIEDGSIGGLFNYSAETTSHVLATRRFDTLRSLAQNVLSCKSVPEFSKATLDTIKENHHDLPFVMLYSMTNPKDSSHHVNLELLGSIGVPAGHPSALPNLRIPTESDSQLGSNGSSKTTTSPSLRKASLPSSDVPMGSPSSNGSSSQTISVPVQVGGPEECPWPIAEALATNELVFVPDCAGLVTGFESRSWGELPETAVVIPISDGDSRQLVLVCGLNTRRPYDSDYRGWVRLLKLQLASGLKGVSSFEAQLRRAEELAKLDKAKTTFFSNVSHELRTPLTLIQGPITDLLALEKEDDGSRRRLLNLADRNVQRLARLVNMLMDVSQVDAGRMRGVFSPKQLGIFTADLASLFRSAIEKGGVKFEVECDYKDPRQVYVDPDLYEKIVYNLIGNAFKYCLEGTIKVYLKYLDNEVELGVVDTGVGIPKEDIPQVVNRFHRVASVGRSFEGTGIGLSLTAELIKLHGGVLYVESCTAEESLTGDHGSAFIVKIPLGTAHLSTEMIADVSEESNPKALTYAKGIIDEATRWSKEEVDSSVSDSGASSDNSSKIDPTTLFWSRSDKVLVVDDNHDMRRYLVTILSQYCTVIEAANGKEALDLVLKSSPLPDLIVSDVMMPIKSGTELVQDLKNNGPDIALIPVLLITARAGAEDTLSGLLMGAEDYLTKPFSSKELVARAHLQMQMGKRRIELERKFAERTIELHIRAQEAEIKRKEAEEGRRQQELLVDVTSHEIRNPVSAILQNAGLCKDNLTFFYNELRQALASPNGFRPTGSLLSMIEEDIESLDAIITMAQSQERIANDVLSLARIQLSTLEIFPVQMDLVKETRKVLAIFASEARLKRIDLSFAFGESLSTLDQMGHLDLLTDPQRLGQVLINLLANAIRFTAASPRKEISVSMEVRRHPPDDASCLPPPIEANPVPFSPFGEEDVWIYGAVKDSGPGLSTDELSRLFQRFKQASPQTHAVFGGSGLGLYVCRRICELMDGKIEVASLPGEGSTFRFFVKASLVPSVPLPKSPLLADLWIKPRPKSPKSAALDSAKGRVLVVEDNLINQKVLNRQLIKAGLTADLADDGQQALNMIQAMVDKGEHYSVILMDLEMPVMDGLTAIRRIREMEAAGELPVRHNVLALTGNARQQQVEQALQMGMDEVVLKPYRIDNLLSKLRALGVL